LPPVLLQSLQRPDLPEGCQCPICCKLKSFAIFAIFYLTFKPSHFMESRSWPVI
jgi:hypothetical protein